MSDRVDSDDRIGWGRLRVHPDELGRVFGTLLAASAASLWLSQVLLVVVALARSEDQPELTATDFPVFLVIGSWVGIWASLLCYSVWSFRQLRRLPDERSGSNRRNPLRRAVYVIALTFERVDEPSTYEERLQLTLQSLVFGVVVLVGVPVAVVHG